ncbi:C40 family peptidase [Cellulosimicrobium cellulans]|uniref:C40 family peptidase n=1 Tax=Cellulosimicrobium cellulans TaxID=1710 RepID=UPI000849592E|nr:C40 family peptidase [Cellulosimicrobium cellulans]
MTVSSTRARHRAARRPVTPLSTIAQAASEQMSTVGRRTAVVAASSGLVVSMIGAAAPASAAPVDNESNKLNSVDLSAVTAQARQALEAAPAVTVAADAAFTIEAAPVTVTPAPEPEPEPEPEPVVERTERTSRTQERQSVQAEAPAQEEAAVSVPASAHGSAIVSIAARYVGVPYVYGGTTPDGFDCSGFTSYVYAQVGIDLPRTSGAQGSVGTKVPRSQAQPGDLIWTPGHIAIYAGDNMQIDAPRPGKTIQFRQIWQSNPTFIRVA